MKTVRKSQRLRGFEMTNRGPPLFYHGLEAGIGPLSPRDVDPLVRRQWFFSGRLCNKLLGGSPAVTAGDSSKG